MKARLPWGEEQQRAMDAVGNIYGGPGLDDRRYGAGGRIEEAAGTAYRHDADGNLIEKADLLGDVTRYRWNGAGMLSAVELPDGREVGFTYDVMARRLSKVVREPTGGDDGDGDALRVVKEVRWVWDGHNPLSEFDSEEGKTTWLFDPETFNPLAKLKDGAVWGVVTDQIGTPTELIAQDGTVAYSTHIDVHGESRPIVRETECPFRWPGQYADEETGLSYNRWRYFDSSLGEYLGQDPLGLLGGGRAYGYVDDPLAWVDPLGLTFTTPPTLPERTLASTSDGYAIVHNYGDMAREHVNPIHFHPRTTTLEPPNSARVFNANLAKELFDVHRFWDVTEMKRRLSTHLHWYNHARTHHALGGLLVPADRYYGRAEEVLARIESGALRDGDELSLNERCLDLFKVVSRGGVPEVWLLGQRLLAPSSS